MIQRDLQIQLDAFLANTDEHPNVLLLEGARQVGKTTLIHQALTRIKKKSIYINLEENRKALDRFDGCTDFNEFEEYLKHSLGFSGDGSTVLCIDEAQESAKLGGFVRFMKENWKNTPVILTGSSMSRIFRNETRFPVGRVSRLQLQPFSFREFCRALRKEDLLTLQKPWKISDFLHQSSIELMQRYLEVGGLPAVVMNYVNDTAGTWKQLRADLFLDYKSDFARIFSDEEAGLFAACLKGVANNLGSASLYSQMIKPTSSLYKKTPAFLTILETWKILYRLDMRTTQASGASLSPKRYIYDVGIANDLRLSALPHIEILSKITPTQREPLGGIVENILAAELKSSGQELVGWRKGINSSEVDFVFRCNNGSMVPIECKASVTTKSHHTSGLQEYGRVHGATMGILVNFDKPSSWVTAEGFRIMSIPLYLVGELEHVIKNVDDFLPLLQKGNFL